MIIFNSTSYTYPELEEPVFDNLSLHIQEGEFILVAGASGCGKSTFLRCINGLIPHFYGGKMSGDVLVNGKSTRVYQPRQLSSEVGFIFQDPESQFITDRVEDEIVFGLENLGIDLKIMRKRVEEVLDQLNINNLRNRKINSLSGGEKQKIALASVLAMQPKILLLDEPTSQLDPNSAEELLTIIQKLNHDLGITVVLSEHRLERVVQYADKILNMENRKYGRPEEVLKEISFAPPLVSLGKKLGWEPLPLTIKEGKKRVKRENIEVREEVRKSEVTDSSLVIEIENLHFAYNSQSVLKRVNLGIKKQEFLAIMGRNGSGKTTLLRHMVGLLKPKKGTIRIFGEDIKNKNLEEIISNIGYIPQNFSSILFKDTVEEEMEFTLSLRGINEAIPLMSNILEEMKLADFSKRYPRDLSIGEQQRVALSSILISDPEIIILDEPTLGMDYMNKKALVDFLRRKQKEGKTIIMVTHDVELVAYSADRVALMAEGEIVVDGDKRDVLSESMVFSPQMNKLFGGKIMTVDDISIQDQRPK